MLCCYSNNWTAGQRGTSVHCCPFLTSTITHRPWTSLPKVRNHPASNQSWGECASHTGLVTPPISGIRFSGTSWPLCSHACCATMISNVSERKPFLCASCQVTSVGDKTGGTAHLENEQKLVKALTPHLRKLPSFFFHLNILWWPGHAQIIQDVTIL